MMYKTLHNLGMIILIIIASCFVVPAMAGNATVSAASGGGAISNGNIATVTWTTLTGPILAEDASNGIGTGTIVLNAPTGFIFNTASAVMVSVTGTGSPGADTVLTSNTATVTNTTISITVNKGSTGQRRSTLTWSGIQVIPTGCLLVSGDITKTGTATYTPSSANYGTLTETGSASLSFIQQPSNTLVNSSITPPVTLNACGSSSTTLPTVTVALTTPAGATLGGTLTAITTNTTGLVTFSNLNVNLTGTYTLTASSTGITSVVSSSFIIYNPLPTTTSITPTSAAAGSAGFTMTVNGTNFVASSVVWFAGTALTTTYVSATQLTAVVPSSLLVTAGSYNISVINPAISGIGGGTSNAQVFSVSSPVVSSFNVVEKNASATSGKIFTKIAGNDFVLDIVALDALNAISSGFTGVVAVEVVDNTTGSGVCADMTTIAALSNQTFVAGDAGRHALSSPNTVADVWGNARVRIKYPASAPTVISCSGDNFAIRPNSFGLSVTDADWQTAGIVRTLDNVAATGGNVHKAGQPFTLQATALNAVSATTTNYTGSPVATISACTGTACTSAFGTLSIGTSAAVAGLLNSNTATYSEVGAFALQLKDLTFADVDAGDGSTADCAGRYICSATLNVGRFVPDHFDTVVTGPLTCPASLTCPAGGLVYSGQSFSTQVTARNAGGAPTVNYNTTTGLSKAVTLTAWDAAGGTTADPGGGTLSANTVLASAFSAGVATTSTPVYTFPTTPLTPKDIYLRAIESAGGDDVSSLNGVSSVEGGVKVVSGRYSIANAYGSELLPLQMTATVQFYNLAGNWVASSTDNITSFNTASNLVATIVTGPLATGNISVIGAGGVTVSGGVKSFTLNKPMVAGSADISLSAPAYLLVGSNVASVDPSKKGRATFGVYKGKNNFIYQRERY